MSKPRRSSSHTRQFPVANVSPEVVKAVRRGKSDRLFSISELGDVRRVDGVTEIGVHRENNISDFMIARGMEID